MVRILEGGFHNCTSYYQQKPFACEIDIHWRSGIQLQGGRSLISLKIINLSCLCVCVSNWAFNALSIKVKVMFK